ncbi:MAG: hypothetical protein KDD69_15975 [Bdellovibrionales bacterium]|nr:hypothetical protein [Bdellovibrionales bacterium]
MPNLTTSMFSTAAPEPGPCVKAYQRGNTILVKYYDDGDRDTMDCPHCHWHADLGSDNDLSMVVGSEMRCPQCSARLAAVSRS